MKFTFKHTLTACCMAYITQAIVNNLPPLLFAVFNKQLGVSLEQLSLLIIINFGVQTAVDLASAKFVDKIGYRAGMLISAATNVVGLILLGILPFVMSSPFAGIVICSCINAVGGGLAEVLVSPIVESMPNKEKASAMSLLHSFYCWGHVGVVLLSTLFFTAFGVENWRFLAFMWVVVPLITFFMFTKVPVRMLNEDAETVPMKKLFTVKIFWVLLVLMICSGAAEQAISQWASFFAETGLNVSKTAGDILGTCFFAILMGTGRLLYGIFGAKLNLRRTLIFSAACCVGAYMLVVFSPIPLLSLIGCGICGLTVAIMWPGVFSLSAVSYPAGGTAMFALLALGGDIGCAAGPGVVGAVSGLFEGENSMKYGIFAAAVFPLLLLLLIAFMKKVKTEK